MIDIYLSQIDYQIVWGLTRSTLIKQVRLTHQITDPKDSLYQ